MLEEKWTFSERKSDGGVSGLRCVFLTPALALLVRAGNLNSSLVFRVHCKKQSDEQCFCIIQKNSSLHMYLLTAIQPCHVTWTAQQGQAYQSHFTDKKTEAPKG